MGVEFYILLWAFCYSFLHKKKLRVQKFRESFLVGTIIHLLIVFIWKN